MTANIPANLYYTKSHEWAKIEDDRVSVGITEFAIEQMNREIINLDLPEVGRKVKQNEVFGIIDSVKAAFELYAPVSGEIVEVNAPLNNQPEVVANSPYDQGWMVKIKPANLKEELAQLLTAEQYKSLIEKG